MGVYFDYLEGTANNLAGEVWVMGVLGTAPWRSCKCCVEGVVPWHACNVSAVPSQPSCLTSVGLERQQCRGCCVLALGLVPPAAVLLVSASQSASASDFLSFFPLLHRQAHP